MRLAVMLTILTGLSLTVHAADAPSADELALIKAAAPAKPSVAPKQARKLLVFSLVPTGYVHTAGPYGKAAIQAIADSTGAFEAVFTDDMAVFEPDRLADFDAVFFNNANNELFMPPDFKKLSKADQEKALARDARLKESLVAFVRGGKGLTVLHASLAIFRQWDEYGDIIGGRFDNHPWHDTVTLRVEDPDHPLLQAFPEAEFVIRDEIYQVKGPYSRDTHRVLLSLDVEKSPKPGVAMLHREDKDFALAWVKPYGNGRIFYNGLGHDHDLFWNPVLLQFLSDGIQFTLGDLDADMTPSARMKKPAK
ncbi:MAG: ThuA domain-containing protein [bacterium]|nr:ThuA domain-containing protein [bacterium]